MEFLILDAWHAMDFAENIAVPISALVTGRLNRLNRVSHPFVRRVKTDPNVISDLPEKIERREYTPLTKEQADLYEEVMQQSFNRIENSNDIKRRGHARNAHGTQANLPSSRPIS